MYPLTFPDWRIKAAVEEVRQVIRLTKPRGRKVLDLCCGPGRFSVNLAKRKYVVTGVDRTKYLLAKARAAARAAGVRIEWVMQDMRDFVRPDEFDLALSMFTSFGFFAEERENMLVLQNMYSSLRAGGNCVIDVIGKERLSRIFSPATSDRLPDGTLLVQLHEAIDNWTRIKNEWILIKRGKAKSYKFDFRVYSGQELKDRMEQAGFRNVKLYGSLAGAPYDRDAVRLVAVGCK
jgi:ubiquinone/menaquinone biosynthesis C-methylase UbiE